MNTIIEICKWYEDRQNVERKLGIRFQTSNRSSYIPDGREVHS